MSLQIYTLNNYVKQYIGKIEGENKKQPVPEIVDPEKVVVYKERTFNVLSTHNI